MTGEPDPLVSFETNLYFLAMMRTFNLGNSKDIGYDEFGNVWRYVNDWQRCFKKFDLDKSGSIRWLSDYLINLLYVFILLEYYYLKSVFF